MTIGDVFSLIGISDYIPVISAGPPDAHVPGPISENKRVLKIFQLLKELKPEANHLSSKEFSNSVYKQCLFISQCFERFHR